MSPADIEQRIREAVHSVTGEVVAVYLYGSRARGDAGPDSDVDLAVLLRATPPATLRNAARELEAAIESAVRIPVQAVVMNTAPADLVHRVLRDGVLLLDRDRSFRLQFEVQSRNEYFDLAPLRRLYRRPA